MADRTDIESILRELRPGQRVRLELDDGTEVKGTFKDAAGDQQTITLEDSEEPIRVGKVERVLLDFATEGPE